MEKTVVHAHNFRSPIQFSSVQLVHLYYARCSNGLDSHECAVKSRPQAKRNSDVFSLRWNWPSVI